MGTQYYRLHGGRRRFAECWCMARSWTNLFKLLAWKPFGGYPFKFSIPRPDVLNLIDPGELPAGFRDRFLNLVATVERIGLEQVFVHQLDVLERSTVILHELAHVYHRQILGFDNPLRVQPNLM